MRAASSPRCSAVCAPCRPRPSGKPRGASGGVRPESRLCARPALLDAVRSARRAARSGRRAVHAGGSSGRFQENHRRPAGAGGDAGGGDGRRAAARPALQRPPRASRLVLARTDARVPRPAGKRRRARRGAAARRPDRVPRHRRPRHRGRYRRPGGLPVSDRSDPMRIRPRTVLKLAGAAVGLLLAVGLAAPYLSADRYGERLRGSLERALGGNRRVEIGKVHFSLFKGPGFSVDSVVIHEDPAIGVEPVAYIQDSSGGGLEVAPQLWSLLGGRFVIASISLDGASINLSKSGAASEWGQWNFSSFVTRSVMSAAPQIHVRNSGITLKLGDAKAVFYLMEAHLHLSPPPAAGGGWRVSCSAKPARTDRPAQGLGSFTVNRRWYVGPERVDLDLELNRSGLGEITALLRGQSGGVHG